MHLKEKKKDWLDILNLGVVGSLLSTIEGGHATVASYSININETK